MTNETVVPERTFFEIARDNVRALVRGAYDFQSLRIQTGNRIAANFRNRLGLDSSEKEEAQEEAKKVLDAIRFDYDRITDGIAAKSKAKSPKVTVRNFKPQGVISNYTEFMLIQQYIEKEAMERNHFAQLGQILRDHAIFNQFLVNVKGVGPAMAGVIISEIDIHKAHTVASLWKYAGVDTVSYWQRVSGNEDVFPDTLEYIEKRDKQTLEFTHQFPTGDPVSWEHHVEGEDHFCDIELRLDNGAIREARYENICLGGRSRKAVHLIDVEYIDKEGEIKTKKSITFNPFLKTKLVGVLGTSFLRSGADTQYRKIYDQYKARITQREAEKPEEERRTKGHIHNMAIRYTVKIFLQNLYIAWRTLEGLPVTVPYTQGKVFAGKQYRRAE